MTLAEVLFGVVVAVVLAAVVVELIYRVEARSGTAYDREEGT